jgi:hypothetical protein
MKVVLILHAIVDSKIVAVSCDSICHNIHLDTWKQVGVTEQEERGGNNYRI